ncbi:CvpA family protein [Flavisolibacter sp. BT320]|nr:CvpA family protein [Flavisolibacter longurius]
MLIDIIAVVLLIIAVFKGLSRGLIVALFSFLAYLIGLAAALKLSTFVADYIGTNIQVSQRWLPFISFLVVFALVVLLVRLGAKAIESAVKMMMLGWLNRIGGMVFYILIYYFIYSIILFYATQLSVLQPATIEASVVYPYIAPFAPKLIAAVGTVIPLFRDMFADLLHFFEEVGTNKATQ